MNYKITNKEPYENYECYEFEFEGHSAIVTKPNIKPNGKWALKTEYFAAFPDLEIELLNRGWHLAFIKNDNRWAEPDDVKRKMRFVKFVSKEFALNQKCGLVGMSCGGLYAARLSMLVPELISVLYLDAPVLNLLSCPCALGVATEPLFEEFNKVTGRTISDMICYRQSPIDKMEILLKSKLPIIIVAGDSDNTVPYCENGAILEKYYKENGGEIEVHIKPGCGHHPHGLENPSIVADFMDRF